MSSDDSDYSDDVPKKGEDGGANKYDEAIEIANSDKSDEKVKVHTDRPYDEAIEIAGSDDGVSTPSSGRPAVGTTSRLGNAPTTDPKQNSPGHPSMGKTANATQDSDSDTDSSSDDSSQSAKADLPAGAYNATDYVNLKVSPEIQELFQYIGRYKPHNIDVDVKIKPFIPDFIPAIGEVDAFLKIPRYDGKPDGLGLTRLDEPCLNPSDPTVLDLQLRSISKHTNLQPMNVHGLENGDKNPKEIKNWIDRIQELHRNKPAPTVQYTRKMPDIEHLMQVWPQEFEEYLTNNPLPAIHNLDDVDLKDYIKIIATILDVPIYGQLTDSLHVIFTLYSEFKNNQHFANQALIRNDMQYSVEPQMPPTSRAPSRQSDKNE